MEILKRKAETNQWKQEISKKKITKLKANTLKNVIEIDKFQLG